MKVSKNQSTVRKALDEMQNPETPDSRKWFLLAFVLEKMACAQLFLDPDQDYWPKPPEPPKEKKERRWWLPWNY